LRKAKVGPGTTLLVNGITGTLGIGGALFGLAMGATRILGTARDRALLAEVKALSPHRIEVHSLDDGPVDKWARALTDGDGVKVYVDCLGPGAPHEAMSQGMRSLARGGVAVNIGAMAGLFPLDIHTMMDQQQQLIGSAWFTAGEGDDMAEMARTELVDLSIFKHVRYPLNKVNEAISGTAGRHGGFSNFVVMP
jgi:alcohol dehydrogenase